MAFLCSFGFRSLLTIDCGLYLPPYKSVNIYFMKEVMAMKKKAIKSKDVQHIYAPSTRR